jgi:hypothetical protein
MIRSLLAHGDAHGSEVLSLPGPDGLRSVRRQFRNWSGPDLS